MFRLILSEKVRSEQPKLKFTWPLLRSISMRRGSDSVVSFGTATLRYVGMLCTLYGTEHMPGKGTCISLKNSGSHKKHLSECTEAGGI